MERDSGALTAAVGASTSAWQADLSSLYSRAKERFPDVVWLAEDDEDGVYAHKAVVYARAPPSFQQKYFTLSNGAGANPSALSLPLAGSRSPSPAMRPATPDSDGEQDKAQPLTRIRTIHNATLLSKELEYLYTARDFGDAFEFLFDTHDATESRVDKLRKDLVFMWRSRLYADCRLALTSDSAAHKGTTAVFSTHRFVLVSRSDYFHNALTQFKPQIDADGVPTVTLPSPPFTPPALHFVLGYLYTGTLVFSNRTYDLDTALAIHRAASFLALAPLIAEVEARLIVEMLHGLYSAYLPFEAYDALSGGRWGAQGCRCRQCARRVPRVLEFSTSMDSRSELLERGARRALVGLFGDGWCHPEFARLDRRAREQALKGVAKRSTPMNAVPLLLSANSALERLESVLEAWADTARDNLVTARNTLDSAIADNAEAVFGERDWDELMHSDGAHFTDPDVCAAVLSSLRRGLNDRNAGTVYEAVVSAVLLRPAEDDPGRTMLGPTSVIRQQVDECRAEIIRWLRKRWFSVRQEAGFDSLERWALQEISSEIEVAPDDLLSTSPAAQRGTRDRPISRKDPHIASHSPSPGRHHHGDANDDSLRASVLARNLRPTNRNTTHSATSTPRTSRVVSGDKAARVTSSASSIRSFTSTMSAQSTPVRAGGVARDSKLGPSSASLRVPAREHRRPSGRTSPSPSALTTQTTTTVTEEGGMQQDEDDDARSTHTANEVSTGRNDLSNSKTTTAASARPRDAPGPARPKSVASVRSTALSVRSKASTVREPRAPSIAGSMRSVSGSNLNARTTPVGGASRTPSGSRPPSIASSIRSPGVGSRTPSGGTRPTASSSAKSTGPATTAAAVTRTSIVRSTAKSPVPRIPSNSKSTGPATLGVGSPADLRARRASAASTHSVASVRSVKSTVTTSTPAQGIRRPPSVASTRSTASPAKKPPVPRIKKVEKELPGTPTSSTLTVRKRGSADTIKEKKGKESAGVKEKEKENEGPPLPKGGATLAVGIPCIVTSQRARFRAYARYIGEVEGEAGPWVGVEVPIEALGSKDKDSGRRPWHDGSWGGIRYFELAGEKAWDGPAMASMSGHSKMSSTMTAGSRIHGRGKREASEALVGRGSKRAKVEGGENSRGLFVRPAQVLYVLDAVGTD